MNFLAVFIGGGLGSVVRYLLGLLFQRSTLALPIAKYDRYVVATDEKYLLVYDVVKMALADGMIEHNSMRLVNSFAVKSGFVENEIPVLLVLIIAGIRQGKDEDELFENYKIRRKH